MFMFIGGCCNHSYKWNVCVICREESVVEEDASDLLHFPMFEAFTDPLKLLQSKRIAQDGGGGAVDHDSSELLNSNRIAQDGGNLL